MRHADLKLALCLVFLICLQNVGSDMMNLTQKGAQQTAKRAGLSRAAKSSPRENNADKEKDKGPGDANVPFKTFERDKAASADRRAKKLSEAKDQKLTEMMDLGDKGQSTKSLSSTPTAKLAPPSTQQPQTAPAANSSQNTTELSMPPPPGGARHRSAASVGDAASAPSLRTAAKSGGLPTNDEGPKIQIIPEK